MSKSDLKAQLEQAIQLAQAGQRAEARALLDRIVEADPGLELAWMWLATVSTDRDERVSFLERALALNPDNPTTQEAYAQLTGEVYTPPAEPPSAVRRMTDTLGQEAPLSLTNFVIILVIAAVAVVAILVVINLRNEDDSGSADRPPTLTPFVIMPSRTPTSRFSPTPSDTPFPTRTPGPSPTPFDWQSAPTWTPRPTNTIAPSNTPLPSSTPIPSRTHTPTIRPATRTFTPLPPTATHTPSSTPGPATQTAEFALTSDGAAIVTPTAEASPSPGTPSPAPEDE